MYKILFVCAIHLIFNTCLMAQARVDFKPRLLFSELKKLHGANVELSELNLSPEQVRGVRNGKYYQVSNLKLPVAYVYIGRVNTCRAGGCSIIRNNDVDDESEFFDYFILFDSAKSVRLVKIFNYQATHGQEISSTSWLKQFQTYTGKQELVVGKNVDAISGATISVDAITVDIEHKTKLLK